MCFWKKEMYLCEKCTNTTYEPEWIPCVCQQAIDVDPLEELSELYGKCGKMELPKVNTQKRGVCDGCKSMEKAMAEKKAKAT